MPSEKHTASAITLLCVVCDRNRHEKAEAVLCGHPALFRLVASGRGTANTRMLSYLGLGESEKSVLLNIMPEAAALGALDSLHAKMQFDRPGHGIAFTAQIDQGCYHKIVAYQGTENGGTAMQKPSAQQYDLIMAVMNRGYSEDVMTAARAAGATGGTVLHARSFGEAGMEKFFGVELTAEKELLLLLASRETACAIMNAVSEKTGPQTDAAAITFSLPVGDVRGLQPTAIR